LVKGIIGIAVVVNLWVWDASGFTILKGEAFIEVWAVLKTGDVGTDILGLGQRSLLSKSIISVAVVMDLRIWDSSGSTVIKHEALIEVRAVLKTSNVGTNILCLGKRCLLLQGVISVAVVVNLWVWDGFGLSILKGEALIEVWAVLEAGDVTSDVLDE